MIIRYFIAILSALAFMFTTAGCTVETTEKANTGQANKGQSGDGTGSSAEDIPGRYQNPLTITPGKAFAVDGFIYAPGWKVVHSYGSSEIKGLKVTNKRGESDSAFVTVKAWKGSEVIGDMTCSSDSDIAPNTTVTLGCFSTDLFKRFDKLTIEDAM